MKQQRDIRITMGWLIAATISLGATTVGAAEIGNVQTNGRLVSEVYGRASTSQDFTGAGKSLRSGSLAVSEVLGRGSMNPANADGKVWINAGDVDNVYGRASGGNQFAINVPAASEQTAALSK